MIRKTMLALLAVFLTTVAIATPAEARHHRHRPYQSAGQIVEHPSGCPHRLFCACGVSMKIWGKAKHMAARDFFKYPRAAPAPGMVAVRTHHVMYIMGVDANGNATVYDPNSGGHQTRIHTRSLRGYGVRNPHA